MNATRRFPGVLRVLFRGPTFQRQASDGSFGDVIKWWERRRVFFNVVVGCTGLVTCALVVICILASESTVGESIGLPDGPLLGLFGILAYGIVANICYTGGWIFELVLRAQSTRERAAAYAPRAFRLGLQFSILLTLLPAFVCWLTLAVALAAGQKHAPFAGDH